MLVIIILVLVLVIIIYYNYFYNINYYKEIKKKIIHFLLLSLSNSNEEKIVNNNNNIKFNYDPLDSLRSYDLNELNELNNNKYDKCLNEICKYKQIDNISEDENIETLIPTDFINNLSSWYGNTWINSLDKNNIPTYKSSNNDILKSKLVINKDIEYNISPTSTKYINKPIKFIYNNLIDDYKK